MSREAEMKEVELNELDQEKQPMTGDTPAAAEKNGCVKVKVPDDNDVKFTGLSKDELMKVAGTAGWVRTRWILLVLFWLGWVGMLAGAIVIIVQAPKCKPIPEMNWWNEGPLYEIADVKGLSESSGLKVIEEKLDSLGQLKVKGLILGPLHRVQKDQLSTLDLTSVDSLVGSNEDMESLLQRAHKKGLSILLDLTPNYEGLQAWFGQASVVAQQLKAALTYWISKGVDGFLVSSLREISTTSAWPDIVAVVQGNRTEDTKKIALMGAVQGLTADEASEMLNRSSVDLLLSGLPDPGQTGTDQARTIQTLYANSNQGSLGWNPSGRTLGRLASRIPAGSIQPFHTLLFTLPGTAVFSSGDEIGLSDTDSLDELWDLDSAAEESNATVKALREKRNELRGFFKSLSDLRGKERALLHGEYIPLHNSSSSLAFLRLWDQSERFITAVNWGDAPVTMTLTHEDLPPEAKVRISTDLEKMPVDSMLSLEKLVLEPKQALLLSYPFSS
ncbi:4F2 cell-surface antigen heavy chain [Chanos chanos]|uniref:4F2 cell-surface antigen heavy chain n=1 Tax=Chanos chanos TaxID=29144 RepID=A0A6J2VWJ8_CHACN|nr:4F2 cell-surface antigen heavy chain [Chanos chanos]